MRDTLIIVARILAEPGKGDTLEASMKILVADTRQEAGCIRYELNRGSENPDLFVFTEEWESHALWQAHMNGEAIRAHRQRVGDGLVAEAEVMQLRCIA